MGKNISHDYPANMGGQNVNRQDEGSLRVRRRADRNDLRYRHPTQVAVSVGIGGGGRKLTEYAKETIFSSLVVFRFNADIINCVGGSVAFNDELRAAPS